MSKVPRNETKEKVERQAKKNKSETNGACTRGHEAHRFYYVDGALEKTQSDRPAHPYPRIVVQGNVGTRNRARNRTRHVAHSSLPYCFQHDACTAMLHAQPMHGLANSVSSPCSWQMMHIVGASAYTALRGARTYTCLVNGSYPEKNSIFGMIYPRTHACTKSAASRLAATTMDVQYTASSAPNVWYDRIPPPRAGITP